MINQTENWINFDMKKNYYKPKQLAGAYGQFFGPETKLSKKFVLFYVFEQHVNIILVCWHLQKFCKCAKSFANKILKNYSYLKLFQSEDQQNFYKNLCFDTFNSHHFKQIDWNWQHKLLEPDNTEA